MNCKYTEDHEGAVDIFFKVECLVKINKKKKGNRFPRVYSVGRHYKFCPHCGKEIEFIHKPMRELE